MSVTPEDIVAWLRERFEEVTEQGALSLVGVIRYTANGAEVPLHSWSSKLPAEKWTPEALGTHGESIVTRDARGLPGVTQYQFIATYGTATKPSRYLPLSRVGALSHGSLAGGGIGGEASTPSGIMDTGRRWGELSIQQSGAMQARLWEVLTGELRSLRDSNVALFAESREAFIALRQMAVASASADADRLIKASQARRSFMLQRELAKMLPGALNAFSGSERPIFPVESADASAYRTFLRQLGDDEMKLMGAAAERRGPAAQAMVAAMTARRAAVIKEEHDEEEKLRELEEQELGVSGDGAILDPKRALQGAVDAMTDAARDAAGLPPTTRQLAAKANGNGHQNGHTNGHATDEAPTVDVERASGDAAKAKLVSMLFDTMAAGELQLLEGALRSNGHAGIADELRRVHDAHKGDKNQ
jgi:hypothetical protein